MKYIFWRALIKYFFVYEKRVLAAWDFFLGRRVWEDASWDAFLHERPIDMSAINKPVCELLAFHLRSTRFRLSATLLRICGGTVLGEEGSAVNTLSFKADSLRLWFWSWSWSWSCRCLCLCPFGANFISTLFPPFWRQTHKFWWSSFKNSL